MLHRLKGGGFGLRLKAGSVRHSADSGHTKVVVWLGLSLRLVYSIQTSSVTLPLLATQYFYGRAYHGWLPAPCSCYANHPNRAIDGKGTRTPQIRQTCWLLRLLIPMRDSKPCTPAFELCMAPARSDHRNASKAPQCSLPVGRVPGF